MASWALVSLSGFLFLALNELINNRAADLMGLEKLGREEKRTKDDVRDDIMGRGERRHEAGAGGMTQNESWFRIAHLASL